VDTWSFVEDGSGGWTWHCTDGDGELRYESSRLLRTADDAAEDAQAHGFLAGEVGITTRRASPKG
jgi:hypothetical protein